MNDCHDRPCPDDDNYECYTCGNPTGNGYDSGQCATCLEEDQLKKFIKSKNNP